MKFYDFILIFNSYYLILIIIIIINKKKICFYLFNDYIVVLEELNIDFSWPLLSEYIWVFFKEFYIINKRLIVLYLEGNQIGKWFRKFKV